LDVRNFVVGVCEMDVGIQSFAFVGFMISQSA